MQIVSIVSQKGGAGKTTVACNLAVAAAQAGHNAIVVDLDPQGSAWEWYQERERAGIQSNLIVDAIAAPKLRATLQRYRALHADAASALRVDWVFLDTPAGDPGIAATATQAADWALIPCRPSMVDLLALHATQSLCRVLATDPFCLLNGAKAYGAHNAHARQAIRHVGLALAPVELGDRIAFQTTFQQGLGVLEQHGRAAARACRELSALYAWLCQATATKEKNHGLK